MEILSNKGRTGIIYHAKNNLVCKMVRRQGSQKFIAENEKALFVEKHLLERLGFHPNIVRYYGPYEVDGIKGGILLGEANRGDLQSYMESPDNKIDNALRRKWCLQMAQALAYVHKKGIIHSNISDTNVLVHETNQAIDLLLADFGGSKCVELSLNGHLLPDIPFGHPNVTDFESPSLDVFSLGVLFYVIITGHYPFHEGPAPKNEEHLVYYDYAEQKYEQGEFPDLSGVMFGDIIAACCCERRFTTADQAIDALCAEMQKDFEDPGRDVAQETK